MVPSQSPADQLRAIISAGVARYQASLPDFAREASPVIALPDHALPVSALPRPEPIIALNEETQRRLCLNCPLPDCVGVESEACPIRIEQRRAWRERKELPR
jgi:hypothetical protein